MFHTLLNKNYVIAYYALISLSCCTAVFSSLNICLFYPMTRKRLNVCLFKHLFPSNFRSTSVNLFSLFLRQFYCLSQWWQCGGEGRGWDRPPRTHLRFFAYVPIPSPSLSKLHDMIPIPSPNNNGKSLNNWYVFNFLF